MASVGLLEANRNTVPQAAAAFYRPPWPQQQPQQQNVNSPGKCSPRLSTTTTKKRFQMNMASKTLIVLFMILLNLGGGFTCSEGFSNKYDNSTITASDSWRYLAESFERMKRGAGHGGGGKSRKEHTCDDSPNKNLCLPKSYSKFELPFTDSVNVVEIGIDIIDVLRINDKEYSVTFSSYFNVLWQEPRLHISERFLKELNTTSPDTMIPVNLELVNELWLPNIFIYNLKTFKVVEVLSKHAGLWITTNNDVFYSQATHITFICPMRFDAFPLDTQRCKFQVGSYSYDDTKMIFLESPRVKGYVETSRSIVLDYDVIINPLKVSDRILSYGSLGNYSLAGFEMILHRYVSHYIITYYLPSGLFVVVSWISFVVPPDVIPGRMALLITLFLVLVNIFNSVTTNTPKAEGLTAIEAWMLACILFVFGALVEYAVILFRRQTSKDHVDPPSVPSHQRVRIICKDNFKYEVAPPELRGNVAGMPPGVIGPQPQQPPPSQQPQPPAPPPQPPQPPVMADTVATVTNSGTNHHLIQHHTTRPAVMAPHHPHHPHLVQAMHQQHPHQGLMPVPMPIQPPPPPGPIPFPNFHHHGHALQGPPSQGGNNGQGHIGHHGGGGGGHLMEPEMLQLEEEPKWDFCGENYINVDRFFLVAMPCLFMVFNVVYWFAYGSNFIMSHEDDEVKISTLD